MLKQLASRCDVMTDLQYSLQLPSVSQWGLTLLLLEVFSSQLKALTNYTSRLNLAPKHQNPAAAVGCR